MLVKGKSEHKILLRLEELLDMLTVLCSMSVLFRLLIFLFNANTCSNYLFFRINFGRKTRNVVTSR